MLHWFSCCLSHLKYYMVVCNKKQLNSILLFEWLAFDLMIIGTLKYLSFGLADHVIFLTRLYATSLQNNL